MYQETQYGLAESSVQGPWVEDLSSYRPPQISAMWPSPEHGSLPFQGGQENLSTSVSNL